MQQIDSIQETLHPKSENPTPARPACPRLLLAMETLLYRWTQVIDLWIYVFPRSPALGGAVPPPDTAHHAAELNLCAIFCLFGEWRTAEP